MINLIIIDKNLDFNFGLSRLFNASSDFNAVSSFYNLNDGYHHLSGLDNILLLDMTLVKESLQEIIPKIKCNFPKLKILMLCDSDDENTLRAILRGADGFLLKQSPASQILLSTKDCVNGSSPMTANIAGRILALYKKSNPFKIKIFRLTPREVEILQLLVDGLSNNQIASQLFISIQTVKNHIKHIYSKLHVHSKSQAVVKAIREGLV